MMEELNLQITDIADVVTVFDYFANQTTFKGWDNIRVLLSLREGNDALKALDTIIEQTAFNNWNNVRQILFLRDKLNNAVKVINMAQNEVTKTTNINNSVTSALDEAK